MTTAVVDERRNVYATRLAYQNDKKNKTKTNNNNNNNVWYQPQGLGRIWPGIEKKKRVR